MCGSYSNNQLISISDLTFQWKLTCNYLIGTILLCHCRTLSSIFFPECSILDECTKQPNNWKKVGMSEHLWAERNLQGHPNQPLLWDNCPHNSWVIFHVKVVLVVKKTPANTGDVRDLGSIPRWGRSLEEGRATYLSILAWRTLWTEEPGGLQSIGLQRAGHDWSNLTHTISVKLQELYTLIFNQHLSVIFHFSCRNSW